MPSLDDILTKINKTARKIDRKVTLMELCGTHTEAVARFGIKKLLPKNVKMLSGPGCPVCVTSQEDIDAIVNLALTGIPIATYGDVLRVPGTIINQKSNLKNQNYKSKLKNNLNKKLNNISSISLDKAREMGADVTAVYSVEESLKLNKEKPNLVFFGIGFETTAPMTATAIKRGLTVYSSHKSFVPAMHALINSPQFKIDGFINPGHVSTIIGIKAYYALQATNYKLQAKSVPQVIAGFEAGDVLIAIYMLLKQISENRAEVENEYTRSVRPEGNPKAMELIKEVFEIKDAYWRGLGKIPDSGFEIRPKYSEFDAKIKYKSILSKLQTINYKLQTTNSECICEAILKGLKEPKDCKLFNKKCAPENPVGACMVSSEGACGIEAKFKIS